jgi:hypothetical protein
MMMWLRHFFVLSQSGFPASKAQEYRIDEPIDSDFRSRTQ